MATVCANIIWSFFRESLDILMYIKGTVHSVLFLVIPLGIAFHCFEKGNICFTRNSDDNLKSIRVSDLIIFNSSIIGNEKFKNKMNTEISKTYELLRFFH